MTPKQEAALRLAADAIDEFCELGAIIRPLEVRDAIREALAEPKEKYRYGTPLLDAMTGKTEQPAQQQEPVAYLVYDFDAESQYLAFDEELGDMDGCEVTPLYISPQPSKPWVDLADEEIDDIYQGAGKNDLKRAREVLAAFKEKNT